jgi:hypothetical protein
MRLSLAGIIRMDGMRSEAIKRESEGILYRHLSLRAINWVQKNRALNEVYTKVSVQNIILYFHGGKKINYILASCCSITCSKTMVVSIIQLYVDGKET